MDTSNQFLELCSQLDLRPRFSLHEVVGRGFADVGYEAFAVLPGRKLLSLFTGKVTSLSEPEEGFFFLIPEVEDLLSVLSSEGEYFTIGLTERKLEIEYPGESRSCDFFDLRTTLVQTLLHLRQRDDEE